MTSDGEPRRSARDAYAEATRDQFDTPELQLGPWTSDSLLNDPKHMCFVLARYKFCAKMFEGKGVVLEVGAGDGFGLPLVAQAVGQLYALDWDRRLLDGNARRLAHLKNVTYLYADLNDSAPDVSVDGAYSNSVQLKIDSGLGRQGSVPTAAVELGMAKLVLPELGHMVFLLGG